MSNEDKFHNLIESENPEGKAAAWDKIKPELPAVDGTASPVSVSWNPPEPASTGRQAAARRLNAKFIIPCAAAFLALIIAVAALLVCFLKDDDETYYFGSDATMLYTGYGLNYCNGESEFYSLLSGAGISARISLSEHSEVYYFIYYYYEDGVMTQEIGGGCIEIYDLDENGNGTVAADIYIYSQSYLEYEQLDEINCENSIQTGDITINYGACGDEFYEWQAEAVIDNIVYRIDYIDLTEDAECFIQFLTDLFSE